MPNIIKAVKASVTKAEIENHVRNEKNPINVLR